MITVTEKAQQRFRDITIGRNYVRLGVIGGGCSGYSYSISLATEAEPLDKRFPQDGFTVLVDPVSLMYLDGIVVDFSETNLSSNFTFNNPNAKRTCGCGSSFEAK